MSPNLHVTSDMASDLKWGSLLCGCPHHVERGHLHFTTMTFTTTLTFLTVDWYKTSHFLMPFPTDSSVENGYFSCSGYQRATLRDTKKDKGEKILN